MPSPNSPDALQFTAPATANGKMTRLEITAPTLTGCAAGDKMSMLWLRDADHGSEDTYTLDTKFTHLMIEWGTS